MKNPDFDRLHFDDWDDHFRQRFADFQSDPPANALKRILADLPAPAISGRNTWFWGGLGAILLLIGSWFVSHRSSPVAARFRATSEQTQQQSTEKVKHSSTLPSLPIPDEDEQVPVINPLAQTTAKVDSQRNKLSDGINEEKKAVASNDNAGGMLASIETPYKTNKQKEPAIPRSAQVRLVNGLESGSAEKNAPVSSQRVPKSDKIYSTNKVLNATLDVVKRADLTLTQLSTDKTATQATIGSEATTNNWQPMSLAMLPNQPLRPVRLSLALPDINPSALPQFAPKQPTVSRKQPTIFVGVMPLFTYQQIDPVQTDEIWIKEVKTQHAFSTQRAGIRFQAGVEWPLSQRLSLRTSLIYNQLNQQVSYSIPTDRPDSVRVERVDEKTIRLIPYFSDKQVTQQTNWHYVGAGADFVFHLGQLGAWRHYASAGVTVGTYVEQGVGLATQPLSGFMQGSYGVERQLTPSLWLRLAPTVQYGLTTVSNADGLFRVRPYTYGLTIGLRK
ncbi:MAG: hypothetical protein LH609_14720 [Rudanella sp.]|nr:hypothetical protein [Rudanella sp.]